MDFEWALHGSSTQTDCNQWLYYQRKVFFISISCMYILTKDNLKSGTDGLKRKENAL